jgi:hypothetical protein
LSRDGGVGLGRVGQGVAWVGVSFGVSFGKQCLTGRFGIWWGF